MAASLSRRQLTAQGQLGESYQGRPRLLFEFSRRKVCGRGHVYLLG